MKKRTRIFSIVLSLAFSFCLAIGFFAGIGHFSAETASAIEVTTVATPNGVSFETHNHRLDASKLIETAPRSIEAMINIPQSVIDAGARGGAIISNYDNKVYSVSLEVVNNAPQLYIVHEASTYTKFQFLKAGAITGNEGTGTLVFDDADSKYILDASGTKQIQFLGDTWTHIVVTIDTANARVNLYLDGVLTAHIENAVFKGAMDTALGHIYAVGNDYRTWGYDDIRFKGSIKQVALYSDVREASEISADYERMNAQTPAMFPETIDSALTMGYDFTQGYPAYLQDKSANDNDLIASEILKDSFNNNDGMTFYGSPIYVIDKKFTAIPATFECEMYLPSQASGRLGILLGNYQGTTAPALAYEFHSNLNINLYAKLGTAGNTSTTMYTATSAMNGCWTHIAYVYDSNTKKVIFYINGESVATKTLTNPINEAVLDEEFAIGADFRSTSATQRNFLGSIRNMAIFSDTRSADEIATDISQGVSLSADNLMAKWDFNSPADGIIEDLTNNGYNAIGTCSASVISDGKVKHSYTNYVSHNDETCTTDANGTAKCDNCARTDTKILTGTATGEHVFTNYVADGNATCTSNGTETAECDTCDTNAKHTRNASTGATGHLVYVEEVHDDYLVSAPTCTVDAVYKKSCQACGEAHATETFVAEDTATGEHVFTNYVADGNATCASNGTETAECDTCDTNAKDTRNATTGATGEHVFTNYVADGNATCTSNGTETAECDTCDTNAKDTRNATTGATGHLVYVEEVHDDYLVSEATCTVDAVYKKSCQACGEAHATETFVAEDTATGEHVFTNYVADGNATCTSNGTETAECDTCDTNAKHTRNATTGATGEHVFTNYVADGNATCTSNGTETAECDTCDTNAKHTRNASTGATGHLVYVEEVHDDYLVSEATCTVDAVYKKSCQACGEAHATETFVAEDTATGEHVFTNYVADGNATCTSNGTETAECDTCDTNAKDTRNATTGATGHEFADEYTCHDRVCENECGHTEEATTEHNYDDGVVTTPPTVDAKGEKTFTCEDCGEITTEEIEKLTPPVVTPDDQTPPATNDDKKESGCSKESVALALATFATLIAAAFVIKK